MAFLRKSTPLLAVDKIEPVLEFWKKLGLIPIIQVPDSRANDGSLALVILETQGIEIMYQTIASLKEDLLKAASIGDASSIVPRGMLYVSVSELAKVEGQLLGERVIMPRRSTLYGAIETGYADRAGNLIFFVEHHGPDLEPTREESHFN
jgi:hypothetical protein